MLHVGLPGVSLDLLLEKCINESLRQLKGLILPMLDRESPRY